MQDASGWWALSDGLGVSLSLQSFVVRALLGSVVAAVLAALAARFGLVRSGRARRTLILAPVTAAGAAALACTVPGSTFLPALVVSSSEGQPFEILGTQFTVQRLEWLLVVYVGVASFLLLRRALGHWAISRYVRDAAPAEDTRVLAVVRRVSSKLGIAAPPLLLVRSCPGGAFTSGVRRPIVAVDPTLLTSLDDRELEGLIAHELAHIARRDVALNTTVAVIRDLTFFVPPLRLAARWLRQEQEHSADDLASEATGRPAALASSILKVWEGTRGSGLRPVVGMACATMVPPLALQAPGGIPGRFLRQGTVSGGAKLIAERVVRLIDRGTPISQRRQRLELCLALGAVILATVVTVVLPGQVSGEILLASWARPPARPVESPAMASFRVLAPTAVASTAPDLSDRPLHVQTCPDCVLLESGAEWHSQTSPSLPVRAPGWQDGGRMWQGAPEGLPPLPSAQTLWGVDSSSGRLGFFLVQSQRP